MPAAGLSQRQVRILGELGVDVWQLRGNAGEPAEEHDAVAPVELPPEPGARSRPEAQQEPQPAPVITSPADVQDSDWAPLNEAIRACTGCALHASRTQAVCGVGNQQADWLVIGEAPGGDEDKKGEPFVGRAGQLLNEMLRAIGLQREQVFIANVLKCRPPNNRDPQPEEIARCLPYLQRQIELLQPKIILVVGRIAAQALLQTETPIGKLRGNAYEYQGVPLVVTYHPAYLLRSPSQKSKSWADLLLALDIMAERSA